MIETIIKLGQFSVNIALEPKEVASVERHLITPKEFSEASQDQFTMMSDTGGVSLVNAVEFGRFVFINETDSPIEFNCEVLIHGTEKISPNVLSPVVENTRTGGKITEGGVIKLRVKRE